MMDVARAHRISNLNDCVSIFILAPATLRLDNRFAYVALQSTNHTRMHYTRVEKIRSYILIWRPFEVYTVVRGLAAR